MAYSLSFDQQAIENLDRLPTNTASRIVKKLKWFAAQPDPLSFAAPLSDARLGHYRFRIGDDRAIIDVEEDTLYVLKIGHRKDIYR